MKRILISYYSEAGFGGDIVAYQHKHTQQVVSKEQYNNMIEREIKELWNLYGKKEYGNFKDFREVMLKLSETDFVPLVEIIVENDENLENT